MLAGERPDPLLVGFKHLRTGALRWSLVRARLVESGPDGERLVVSTFHDMTTQVEAGQASLADERRYREIVEALPVVAWLANPDGTLAAANRWHAHRDDRRRRAVPGPDQIHPDDRAGLEAAWTVARATEEALDSTVRLRRHDGAFRWHVVRAVPLRREGHDRGLDRDGDRHRRGTGDPPARRRPRPPRRRRRAPPRRVDDLAETIDAAAVLAIPELADWCVIDLVEPDGSLRRVAAVAGDPAAQSTLDGIRDF